MWFVGRQLGLRGSNSETWGLVAGADPTAPSTWNRSRCLSGVSPWTGDRRVTEYELKGRTAYIDRDHREQRYRQLPNRRGWHQSLEHAQQDEK